MRRKPNAPASVFAALGDETRLGIVVALASGGPASIARLTEGSTVTRQAVTKHLGVLHRAGLVRGKRRGRERLWQLESTRLESARHYLSLISTQWDDALGRLRRLVEE